MTITNWGAQADEAELIERYDERYETGYMERHHPLVQRTVDDTLAAVAGPVASVLDFGCGQGFWVPALERAFPGASITGVEISGVAVDKARARFTEHTFELFDGNLVPFPEGSFDLVFSYHVLEHVHDFDASIAEMVRLTRPGGRIVAIYPCGNAGTFETWVASLTDAVEGEPGSRLLFDDPSHLRRPLSSQTIDSFSRAGAVLETERYANRLWGSLHWVARAGSDYIDEMLDGSRAVSRAARMKLAAARAGLKILAPLLRAHEASPLGVRLSRASTWRERLAAIAMEPAKLLGKPVGLVLDALARREWDNGRVGSHGSVQHLVFRRTSELGA